MTALESIQANYPAISSAAGQLLRSLGNNDLQKDIILTAELAGLMLLRDGGANLEGLSPGTGILGAVADEAMNDLQRFIFGFAKLNGLGSVKPNIASLDEDAKRYRPDVVQYESRLYAACVVYGVPRDLYPFVAACAALKLVLTGQKLKLLSEETGLGLVTFHVIYGAKTVPHPDQTGI
jgi:hypothetical protein